MSAFQIILIGLVAAIFLMQCAQMVFDQMDNNNHDDVMAELFELVTDIHLWVQPTPAQFDMLSLHGHHSRVEHDAFTVPPSRHYDSPEDFVSIDVQQARADATAASLDYLLEKAPTTAPRLAVVHPIKRDVVDAQLLVPYYGD